MVLLDPPAPAARDEEGRGAAGARRLRWKSGRYGMYGEKSPDKSDGGRVYCRRREDRLWERRHGRRVLDQHCTGKAEVEATHRTALAPGGRATVKDEEDPVAGDPGDAGRWMSD